MLAVLACLFLVVNVSALPRIANKSQTTKPKIEVDVRKSEKDARIIRYISEDLQDGYRFAFNTTNGISHEEVGKVFNGPNNDTGVLATEGRVQWVTPKGARIEMYWHADENGFQPRGSHFVSMHWHPVDVLPPISEDYKLLKEARKNITLYNNTTSAETSLGAEETPPNTGRKSQVSGTGMENSGQRPFKTDPGLERPNETSRKPVTAPRKSTGGSRKSGEILRNSDPRSQKPGDRSRKVTAVSQKTVAASRRAETQPGKKVSITIRNGSAARKVTEKKKDGADSRGQSSGTDDMISKIVDSVLGKSGVSKEKEMKTRAAIDSMPPGGDVVLTGIGQAEGNVDRSGEAPKRKSGGKKAEDLGPWERVELGGIIDLDEITPSGTKRVHAEGEEEEFHPNIIRIRRRFLLRPRGWRLFRLSPPPV